MSNFEVQQPILNSPYAEPKEHWWILEGQQAERRPGRRPAIYFYRDPVLNKVNDRSDGRFSDVALVVVPNVTIRDRCRALDPELGEASLYRTRDLVPGHLMERLRQGKVLVTNWHIFEPQSVTNGEAAKVVKRGREILTTETIRIGEKNDTKRGTRFLTRKTLQQQIGSGMLEVVDFGTAKSDKIVTKALSHLTCHRCRSRSFC